MVIYDLVTDILIDHIVTDVMGEGGDVYVSNLELEDGNDYLLEDGSFILLE